MKVSWFQKQESIDLGKDFANLYFVRAPHFRNLIAIISFLTIAKLWHCSYRENQN